MPFMGFSTHSFAQGDLIISPTRIVFDGKKSTQELNLVNNGNDTSVYTVTFVQKNMKEDGSFENIETPDLGQMFADEYVRVYPRTIKLAPGEAQVVKLQYTRKKDMKTGEYRSHLYFRAEKGNTPIGMNNTTLDSKKMVVQLVPIYGISVPIIIHSGNVSVTSNLSNLKLTNPQEEAQTLNFTINRAGNSSLFGDLIIDFIPKQGKPFQVGVMNGVGVYTNISTRNMVMRLNNNSGRKIQNGKLKIQYVNRSDAKQVVLAKAEIDV